MNSFATKNIELDINLQTAPRERGNEIFADFAAVRSHDPVFWSAASHCWILTRYTDVSDLFMGRLPLRHSGRMEAFAFSAVSKDDIAKIPTLIKYVPQWIINLDGPDHQRIRSLLVKAFSRGIVENLRAYAREKTHTLLDAAILRPDVEFNEEIARELTGHVLFKLIGMPEHKFPALKDWATAIVEGMGAAVPSLANLERADRAAHEMNEAVMVELERRRVEPQDDLLTNLLNVTEAGERLSIDELLAQMQIIIVAGHDTTTNTMSLATEALARHPEALQYMYDHPDRIQTSVAELQRYSAMSGGQALLATEDFELGGKQIRAGQVVVGMIAAADRDERKFEQPEALDMTRNNSASLVFAPGPHFCLGHLLAKMQLAEFFGEFVRRFERIEMLDDRLDFTPVFSFRGVYSMRVRLHLRAGV